MIEEGRIGTIDLVIDVLREHERIMNSLFNQLDTSIDRMDIKRIEAKVGVENQESEKTEILVEKIAELEEKIKRYEKKIKNLENQIKRLKKSQLKTY